MQGPLTLLWVWINQIATPCSLGARHAATEVIQSSQSSATLATSTSTCCRSTESLSQRTLIRTPRRVRYPSVSTPAKTSPTTMWLTRTPESVNTVAPRAHCALRSMAAWLTTAGPTATRLWGVMSAILRASFLSVTRRRRRSSWRPKLVLILGAMFVIP